MMHANKLSVFLFVALGLLGGCSDSRRNLDLLPHDNEPSPGDESAEVERLRRLQMVRLINHTDPENSFEETVDPEVLEGYFRDTICQKELDTCALNGLLDKCNICLIDEALCIANHLLDVAGTRSTPVELELTTIQPIPPLYSIPPQPTATNAALARIAFKHYAPAAVFRAFRHARVAVGLDDLPAVSWFEVNPDPCDAGTTAEPGTLADRINPNGMLDDDPSSVEPGSISVAAALGQRVAESLSVFREAGFRTVELELAVADQQRSNPSLSHQVSRGLTGWELSRVSAAHLLVGGSPGLLGTTRDTPRPGVCSTPQLSAQGEKALGILRDAGVSPAAVQADPTIVSLDELLNGDASDGVPDGSVKQRFGQRWGFNFDAPPAGIDVRESIGDYFHLRDEDFEEARRYLDQEITAFSRSQSAQIEPPPVAAGYRRFAGTAQPPKPLPAEYYATIASYNVFQRSHQAEPPILFPDVVPKPGGGQVTVPNPNMASVMDAALTHAALVLDEESVIPTPSLRRDLMTPLATMHMGDSGRGRAVICRQAYLVDTGLVFEFEFDVGGFKSTDGLAVVRGEDGLRCALDGSVEGGNCDLKFNHTDVNQAYKLADLTSTGAGVSGFDDSASGSFAVTSPMDGERIYIVQRTATGSTPGSYKPLAGFHLESETQNNCFDVPIVPEVSKRVADIMAPSTKWCSTSQVSCAGTQFDERLPLEDELTNDSDGVESSWKHYLALAKEAAARSDQLGQEYVNSGLEFETRLESVELRDEEKERMAEDKALAAVDELQKICGTAIDPIRLLKLLSTGSDQNNLALVKDTEAPPCAPGYKQILGSCVFDLSQLLTALAGDEAYSDFVRLNECLSEDSVKSFVHLGSKERPLCLWHEASDPRKLCVAKDATHPCPILAAPNGGGGWSCANLNLPTSTPAKIPVAIAESLELVDTRALSTFEKAATGEPLTTCDQIRKLRESPDATYLDSVRGTGRFTAARMTELAKRIAFRARYGSYSAVTLDGATRYSTGTAWSPPPMTQTSWPCAAATGIQGCPGPGLFCDKVDDCTQEQQRGRMNDRLVRAVLAINASLGDTYFGRATHAQFEWPVMVPRHMDNPNADAKLEGATARDFWENASISHPFTEYTSASGPIGPEGALGYESSEVTAVNRAYAYSAEPNFAVPLMILTNEVPADRVLLFGPYSLPNNDYESTQLRLRPGVDKVVRSGFDGDDKIDAAMYFWDGMSRDNRPAGYYQQKLQHNSALGPATLRGLPPFETGDHTQHFWIKFNYEEQAMLDGLELLCQLGDPGLACSAPPEITSVADLPAASSAIRCIADQITRAAGTAVLSEFPVQALDPLRRESSIGSFPATGGALGVDISSLRGALAELADVPLLVGDQIKQLSAAIDSVYLAVQDGDLSKKLADVELQSTMASQISTCMASAAGLSPGAIATCANSLAQVGFAEEINSISKQKAELGVEANFNDFTAQFSTISTTMGQLANRLTTALSTIDAQLVAIEQQHNQAKLALARALYVRTFTSQFETRINAVHASRFQTARTRYEQAHTTAQRMAFLAKRAIEMRLGLRLSELTDELPLVEAPAKWESTVCATTGINYESLADGSVLNYADAFIGEDVAKLEHVVESYRLVNNFHEGADAAVISLRDDVHNMKAICAAPVGNELYHAGQLNTGSTGTTPGWDRVGCRTQVVGVQTVPVPNCIGILEEDGAPVLGVPERSTARAHRLQFGDLEGCTSTTTCGYQTGAALAQEVEVSQGTYRASVYVRDRALFSDVGLRMALDGVNITGLTQATQPATLTAWARVYIVFDVPKVQTLRFAFGRPTLVSGMTPADDIVLAAPMLERLPTFDLTEIGAHPVAFANTTASLTCLLPVCEDTTGEVFRNKAWRRGSARLCPDGFTGECAGSTAREIGYWETSFSINQRDIESGRILGNSGFAKGNFNYRIDSIGVNFVGTGVRNCSESTSPSTCYASGFVPYSLIHNGPYIVRNHQGKDFEAKLFTGRIEHARGLATERYLTSPLSSSDRDLLTDFKRLELQGRPLDGNFVLRVWDDPGVDFGALEDVQIVLNYRYWTRFN